MIYYFISISQGYKKLTCTATPKLFPSSILGTWSWTHIDTLNTVRVEYLTNGNFSQSTEKNPSQTTNTVNKKSLTMLRFSFSV